MHPNQLLRIIIGYRKFKQITAKQQTPDATSQHQNKNKITMGDKETVCSKSAFC